MPRHRTTPASPAAVSGPGALSERTDGGPGSDTQPIRVAAGGPFGSRQELEDAQRAAPLPDRSGSGAAPGGPVAGPGGPPPPVASEALFGPTTQPGPGGPRGPTSFIADDPDLLLKTIYQAYPHPEIRRLVNDIAR